MARSLLETRIIATGPDQSPVLRRIEYSVREYPEGSGRTAVVRAADPEIGEGLSEASDIRPILTLDIQESFDWEVETTGWRGANSPARLKLELTNSRFENFTTRREILVHGVANE